MIWKYSFGRVFPTEAVVNTENVQICEEWPVSFLQVSDSDISYRMAPSDVVYGLGENVRGMNKRGWKYISDCSDNPDHHEDASSLYGAHNFLILDGERRFGIFIDDPGKLTFDVGYTNADTLRIIPENWDLDFYLIEGESLLGIVRQFRHMIGRSYIPPKWAFGYAQCRWSYETEDEVREVVQRHKENDIPLDIVNLDIDYMERYKDFTVNEETFPQFPAFVQEMKEQGIHLVPIIDAAVKKEEGYDVYEEGTEKGYFCKREDGSDFVTAVWPGYSMLPDMLNDEARKWFGDHYAFLLDQGIEGFWNDMNEPALFYSEENLSEAIEKISALKGRNLGLQEYFGMMDIMRSLANSPKDYQSFYHETKEGRIRHDKLHNLYGYYMTRSAGEAFERLRPDQRILMYSRASYTGMHRYGGIWQGDNKSWWSHLKMNIQMSPSLNMCGFLYTGADTGGFGSNTTGDLVLRWTQFSAFTPLMRNHCAMGMRRQEVYQFEYLDAFRAILKLRYRLLPYLYSEYMKAALRDGMYFCPMAFLYPKDAHASQVEDQLFVGESLMIAPVYTQNADGRYVYLPEEMRMFRLKKGGSLESEILAAGHHYIDVPLEEMIFFLRKDHAFTLAEAANRVEDVDFEHLTVYMFGEGPVTYEYYHDDGNTKDYENPAHFTEMIFEQDGEYTV